MSRTCPTCRGQAHKDGNKLWPFCSERCHLVDLGRWLLEDYRIAGPAEPLDVPRDGDDDSS